MGVFIIAEAGVNHNGDLNIAKRLVDAAVEAGADAVKFQMFKAEKLAATGAELAKYQKQNISFQLGDEEEKAAFNSQRDMLRKLELSEDEHILLQKYCEEKGIAFLSSPFDVDSMRFLISIGMDIIKIPSGEITNYPYLREAAKSNRRVILSTGMCTMDEVKAAVEVLNKYSKKDLCESGDLVLLHCNTQYPTPYTDVNLRAMKTLAEEFKCRVGYSDHTLGVEIPVAAVAMGATVIEKHFTLDKNMEGPDHKASLEPDELKTMVTSIRHIEEALGDGIKKVTESERGNISVARKSIIAATEIKTGDIFTEDNLTTKRPGNGISPMRWDEIIGQKADRDYHVDEKIM